MIDLHTHTIFSDGLLVPSELVRRAADRGYRAIALTDHADHSNYDFIIPRIVNVCSALSAVLSMHVIPGIELTHLHPSSIKGLTEDARELGARIVVVHGETLVEPVLAGTNKAAILAGADILAHPGLITRKDADMAAEKGICLEISARKGHSLTNGHVVNMARLSGAMLVLNTDAHAPDDLLPRKSALRVAAGAGLSEDEIEIMFGNSELLCDKAKLG
ncbi:MAG: histidinol phosphate phosphatase domain-containing protein [Syntrophales bacterium]|nr:histidinol phosphate phosphatase domain-containing protein [Syntrophales bacterium]